MYRHGNIISNSPLHFIRSKGLPIGSSTTGLDLHLDPERLARHLLVIGKTGSGKSNFLKALIEGIIDGDRGSVLLLDPHGNLAREAASWFPESSSIITPIGSEEENGRLAISLNAISIDGSHESNNIAAGWIKDAFASEGVFSHGTWGPRLEVVFTSILQELLRKEPDTTLADLLNLLLDGNRMRKFISGTENSELKSFLKMQVSDWRGWNQYVTSSINKLLPLLTDHGIKNLISGTGDSFSMIGLFEGRSRLVIPEIWGNVVPDDSFKVIGMLLLLKLWLQRIRSGDADPVKPIYMVFDEAQLIPGGILDRLLREGRKFGFRIIMATQFLGKGMHSLSETIRGNVGNVVSFNVFEQDAFEISSNFFTGNIQHKLQQVMKAQPIHSAVIWSQDEDGLSGPLSFSPTVHQWNADDELFREMREKSLRELGTYVSGNEPAEVETGLHEFLILKFQDYLSGKGIESDRHRSFHGAYPDLYFEYMNSTVFVEVEISDLVNISRTMDKAVEYSGNTLVFIAPPGASSTLFNKILLYIDKNWLKLQERLGKGRTDILSKVSILEYDKGFHFLSAGKLKRLKIEHLFQGTFMRTLHDMALGEIRSYLYAQMAKKGSFRMEFPEKKIEQVFGKGNCARAMKEFCGKSSIVSLHDLFGV